MTKRSFDPLFGFTVQQRQRGQPRRVHCQHCEFSIKTATIQRMINRPAEIRNRTVYILHVTEVDGTPWHYIGSTKTSAARRLSVHNTVRAPRPQATNHARRRRANIQLGYTKPSQTWAAEAAIHKNTAAPHDTVAAAFISEHCSCCKQLAMTFQSTLRSNVST